MDYDLRHPDVAGGPVARAKRTDRADARRRHRAQLAGTDEAALEEDALPAAAPSKPRAAAPPRPGRATASTTTPPRPAPAGGIRNAFRLAFHPLTLREDLALFPRLLLHRAFWLPVLIAAIVTGAVIAFQGRELISQFGLTYFVYPPPLGALFLAGFLAPRASYLIGAAVGVVTAFLLGFVVASVPNLFTGATFVDGLIAGLATSPLAGAFMAAAAAWYRRFLYLASPARQAPNRGTPPRGKPARGR
jgi:hypothetical protein